MEENTQNMLADKPYTPATDEIHRISRQSHRLCHDFNQLYDTDREQRNANVDKLLGKHGQNVYISKAQSTLTMGSLQRLVTIFMLIPI